ncbi:MAG: hypothetical protein NTW21_31125 [Verrucomicrobia bacterium]|nr:hypothetical protein [Verrucomicrobiota bacterium]
MNPTPSMKSVGLRRLAPLATVVGALALGVPSQAGLVAHYPLRADVLSTTGTHPGTFEGTGGANAAATFVEDAKFGNVFSFDGTDDRINLGNVLTLSGNSYSLSFWVQTPAIANTVPLIGKNNGNTGFEYHERVFEITGNQTWGPLHNGTPGNFAVNGHSLGGVSTAQTTISLDDGTWHMITAVHDQSISSTHMSLYLDGMLQANHNDNGMMNTGLPEASTFFLGFSNYSNGGAGYLNGKMAEVNFYDSAITAEAVAALYAFTPPTDFWTVMASADAGGTISPVGAVAVPKGTDQPFIITPDKYFDVTGIMLDTGAVTVTSPDAQTYTMAGVAADGSIAASFTEWTETTISGKVSLADTTAVGGVLITASGGREPYADTTSAADGTYSIRVKPGETYTLTATVLPARTMVDTAPAPFTAVVAANPDQDFTLKDKPVTLLVNYTFNGNCDDSSGNAKHGTLKGAATYGTGYMNSGSLDTTAATGACSVPALGDGESAAFTMCAWLKPTQNAADYDGYRMALYQEPGWGPHYVHVALTTYNGYRGMVAAIYGADPERAQSNMVSEWSLGTWHHVAIVYDSIAKTVKYYYDGVPTNTENYTSSITAVFLANAYIGSASGDINNRPFRGEISDFRLYSDVLSDAEVAALVGVVTDPYTTWIDSAAFNTPTALSTEQKQPTADPDGDGMTNQQEFAFGLNPVLGSSLNPITVPLDNATGKFSYTRLAASGLTYHVFTSTDLQDWAEDLTATASQVPGTPDGNGVQTVDVTITGPLPSSLFARVAAAQP